MNPDRRVNSQPRSSGVAVAAICVLTAACAGPQRVDEAPTAPMGGSARPVAAHHRAGEKPAAPQEPGESRPPAGHSEHREHMREHGQRGHGMQAPTSHHRFTDAKRWAKVFESPKRDAWQRGDAVVAALQLKPDSRVADIGAGTGYFAVRFARVARAGVVYAVDVEPNMVRWVQKRAARERLENLVGVVGTATSPKLPGAVDLLFVCNTYHHIGERSSYFARLHRKLNKGGRLVVIDFKMGDLPVGPPDAHKIAPERIVAELDAAGFALASRDDTTLPYQHLLTFKAK